MTLGYWLSYAVPTSFSLDANSAITSILAQIPFDAMGVLGIAAFTLFIYSAQVDRLSLTLFVSVLFAFIAVIFDLAQLLARGGINASPSSDNGVQGLVTIRETAFALSLALRYMWVSGFVVRSVQASQPQPAATTNFSEHGALSWKRFGALGLLIQWSLLTIVATIFGLQVAWRLMDGPDARPIYYTSAGLEVGLLVIFCGKLGLNFAFVKDAQRWCLFRTYAVPTIGLLFQFSVAFGNLFDFPFSETVLGRFLQAIGLYLFVLWTMADGYTRHTSPASRIPNDPPVLPVALRRGSTLRLSIHNIPSNTQIQQLSPIPDLPQSQDKRVRRSRPSITSRSSVTSWIANRRILRAQVPYDNDDERLWVQDQAELGFSPVLEKTTNHFSNRISEEPRPRAINAPSNSRWMDPMFSALSESPEQVDDIRGLGVQPFSPPILNTPTGPDILSDDHEFDPEPIPPMSSAPFARAASPSIQWKINVQGPASALSTPKHDSSLVVPTFSETENGSSGNGSDQDGILLPPRSLLTPGLDSPVYGLEGVRTEPAANRPPNFLHMSTASSIARSSLTSHADIEEVLRRQQVLDRSIEKLKLTSGSRSSSVIMEPSTSRPSMISSISGVSLTQFPAPPWLRRSLMPGSSRSSARFSLSAMTAPVRASRRSASLDSTDLRPPQMPAVVAEGRTAHVSLPESLRDSMDLAESPGRSPKFGSKGTEYVITSFIAGDLSLDQSARNTQPPIDRGSRLAVSPPQASSIRYIKPEDLPLGSGGAGAVRVRNRTASDNATRAPAAPGLRGPRPRESSLAKVSLTNLNKEIISGPRPLRPVSVTQQFSERPRKAPAAPNL